MIVRAKMKHFIIRGGEGEDIDDVTICNVHLHHMTAKRALEEGSRAYHDFFDQLAQHLAYYGPRFLCGVFHTAVFCVVPELRARGFEVSVAAWQCWQNTSVEGLAVGDSAILRIGPCKGIRMCFDASVFGFGYWHQDWLPPTYSMVMEKMRNRSGKVIGQRKYVPPTVHSSAMGLPLTSYQPIQRERRNQFVRNTFTPVSAHNSSAVAEMQELAINEDVFSCRVDTSLGTLSWYSPEDVLSKQKLVDPTEFDPNGQLSRQGIRPPLMIFMVARAKRKH